jgi:hypothetical protein
MSGHNRGTGPQPHHTRHPAILAAAAAIIVLALGEIRNQAGNYVLPSTQTIAAAAAHKPAITPTPPPTSTSPCQPRSANSPSPCSSKSPAPPGHTS